MDAFSIVPLISELVGNEKNVIHTHQSMRKLFQLECRSNMKLLDITKWDDCPAEIRNAVIRRLNNDAAKAYFATTDNGFLGALSSTFKSPLKKEEKSDNQVEDSVITSLIVRIDALKFLAQLPEEHLAKSNPNFTLRIKNLKTITLEALKIVQSQ